MKNSLKLIVISMLGVCLSASAQDASDLAALTLDLTRTNNGGSARILGLGGAQTAIGGDISSVSSNPAGLGFFNRSEISFSTQFNGVSSTSTFLDNPLDDSKLNLNLPNLGAVIKSGKSRGKWKGQSFGISLNRMADFQRSMAYEGSTFVNEGSTFLERFRVNEPADFIESAIFDTELNGANPVFFSDFAELAFSIGLTDIFEDPDNGELFVDRNIYDLETGEPALPVEGFPTVQREAIDIRGASSQFSLSYGANYNDKIYIGAGIGISNFNKDVERIFTERPTRTDLAELRFTEVYEQSGIGINGTFGIIARPADPVLLGLSYTTPTYHSVSQTQETELSAEFVDGEFFADGFIFQEFDYNITTPSRLRGGATFFINKSGFITTEVEYVDYSGGNISGTDNGDFFDENNQVINRYDQVLNYRIGAEYRHDILRLRGGFAYLDDPFDNNLEQAESQFTFGAGIRKQEFYVDVAVVGVNAPKSRISPYPGAPSAIVENDNTRVTFTVGFAF